MENQYQHLQNGQEVLQEDLNLLGTNGALADDRTLAELLRITPYDGTTVVKRVLPYKQHGYVLPSANREAIVWPGTGQVAIMPFRAIIGSRTAVASNAKNCWRDIRSAIMIGAAALGTPVAIAADSGGGARFDLIYAKVTVDKNAVSVSRKVKDPSTLVVAPVSVVTQKYTEVTVGVIKGTEGSATKPALTADSGSDYYIALAYVRVPAGFDGATALSASDIWEFVEPACLGHSTRPANQNYLPAGTVQTRSAWSLIGAPPRPYAHMPSTMIGKEELLIAVDLASANPSHQDGDIVDNSRDWSRRVFRWTAYALSGTVTPHFPWEPSLAGGSYVTSQANGTDGSTTAQGQGQSFYADSSPNKLVMNVGSADMSALAAASSVKFYVDTSGVLRISITGSPNAILFVWLEASGQFGNAS